MKYLKLIIILLSLSALSMNAQQFVYKVDALGYFDNREYDADFQRSQTLFAIRLSPEIGAQLSGPNGGQHRLMLGAHYTKPMGMSFRREDFVPTLYYCFHKPQTGFKFYLGALPYENLSQDLPAYVLYDSIAYVHPNIQGALVQFQGDRGFYDLMCDWRSMQSEDQREAFRLLMNGRYGFGIFQAGGLIQMNHLASKKFQKNGVCDDAFINPVIGVNIPLLDSLYVQSGYIWSYQWDRIHAAEPILSESLVFDLYAQWKFIGLKNTLFVGNNLQPLYSGAGNELYLGDPFYQSTFYNRCDVFFYLLRNNFVNCLISWNLHYTKEFGLDHQQQLICRLSTDWLRESRPLKNLFGK